MNKNTIISALGAGVITVVTIAVIYGVSADLNHWSRTNGVQEKIELETTTSGALNVREMVESGGVK